MHKLRLLKMRDPKVSMWFNAKSWSSMTPLNSSSSNRGKPVQDWGGGYHMVITSMRWDMGPVWRFP